MDRRRRIIILSGALAAISASSSILLHDVGVTSDFWKGVSVGLSIGLSVLAIALTLNGRSRCTMSRVQ
jgi:hypothetical protein